MSNPIVSFDEEAVKSELREWSGKPSRRPSTRCSTRRPTSWWAPRPYERTDGRAAYRAGHYERGLTTTSGQVTLRMPKLKGMRFATAIIERYKRRETCRRGGHDRDVPGRGLHAPHRGRRRDPGGAGVSAGTVSNLNDKAFKAVEVAMQAPDLRVPVRLRRRHLPQEKLGRLLRERGRDGGHRRQRRRLPRGDRLRRGLHRVVGVLARLPVVAEVARGCAASHVHRRQGRRRGRQLDRRGLPWRQNTSAARCTSTATSSPRFRNRRGRRRRPCSRRSRDGVLRGGRRQGRPWPTTWNRCG